MSLRDAVEDIAKQLDELAAEYEKDCETYPASSDYARRTKRELLGMARQLRTAVKASEGERPPLSVVNLPNGGVSIMGTQGSTMVPDHRSLIDKAREEIRREKAASGELHEAEESLAPGFTTLVGGSCNGDMVPRPEGMPVGAHSQFGGMGEVYTLMEDGQLHYNEQQTKLLRKARSRRGKK